MSKNMTMYDNLTRAQERSFNLIQSLGIYELRAIARVFGDNSPATSKRDDYIKFIMDKIIKCREWIFNSNHPLDKFKKIFTS